MLVSVLLLCLPSVYSVAYYIQYLIHWFLCRTPFTRIIFLNMAFSKASLNMAFSKTRLHTCFGLNLNRGLNKTNVFASKPSFTQRAVLHKNHVLVWSAQGLFAAYRIALSMVAGGTRRREKGKNSKWQWLAWNHPISGGSHGSYCDSITSESDFHVTSRPFPANVVQGCNRKGRYSRQKDKNLCGSCLGSGQLVT